MLVCSWSFRFCASADLASCRRSWVAMPTVHVTVHPRGLHPTEAVRAWHLHVEDGMGIRDVCDEVVNMLGQRPSYKAVSTDVGKCRTAMLDWGGRGARAASYSINNNIVPRVG